MSKILALDTTQAACSVALLCDDQIIEASVQIPRQHTKQILPLVDKVLSEAGVVLNQVDAISFGRGPGSFTGLRIACGITQGLAFSADLPVIPVSSLAALAVAGFESDQSAQCCFASFDARMGQVYGAFYQKAALPQLLGEEFVIEPESVLIPDYSGELFAVGSGATFIEQMPDKLQQQTKKIDVSLEAFAKHLLPIAEADLAAGCLVSAEDAEPSYVRQQVTWKKINQQ